MAAIMIVDDAAFLRAILKDMLHQIGHIVVAEAADGEEAIRKYKTCKPDLVTLDISMPGMDGLQALKEIRRFDPQAKVLMCSVIGQKDMILNAVQNGAKDFIVKPFQNVRVWEAVNRVMSEGTSSI